MIDKMVLCLYNNNGKSQLKVISLKLIRRKNLPYICYWVIHYMWVVVFTTWWTHTPYSDQVFTYEARSITHAATLLFSAILIMFCKKRWFVTMARAGSIAMLAFMTFYLFALTPEQQRYAAPIAALIISVECIGIFVPFILLMNNTEKYYSMLIAFVGVNIFSLLYQERFFGSISEKITILAIVAVLAVLAVTFRKKDLHSVSTEPLQIKPPLIAYLSLVINCFSCVFVKGIGKVILDSMETASPGTAYFWHFTGGLVGCALYLIVFALVKGSLQIVQNITFGSFLLAVISFALSGYFPQAVTAVALFTGLSGTISMVTLYYNLGVIGGKYKNVNHLKQALWCGVIGGGGSVLIGYIAKRLEYGQTIILLSVTSVSIIFFYYLLLPFLIKTYYKQQWLAESEQEAETSTNPQAGTIDTDGVLSERAASLSALSFDSFTAKELEAAGYMLQGLSVKTIAHRMNIPENKAVIHSKSVYSKLNIHSKNELFTLERELARNKAAAAEKEESLHAKRMKILLTHTLDPLTNREYQLADCIMRGLRRSEIANEMDVLPETVTKYANRVYNKFDIHSRKELFKLAEQFDRQWQDEEV